MVMMMLLRGSGDAHTPFRFTLVWIVLQLVLAPGLMVGWGPLPALGIAGLGLGALISNGVALGALVAYVYWKRSPIALHGGDLAHFRPDPRLIRLLVRRGVPQALESVVVQGAYFTLLAMVNAHGAVTASAYAVAAQLWAFVQLPSNALAMSMSAIAAMNIGAGRWDRAAQIARRGCTMSLGIAVAATALIYALGDLPLRLFVPAGGPVLDMAWQINLYALWGWVALSITMGLFAIMRANGAMLAPMLIFACTMWLMRVPFAAWLQPWLGPAAIWLSFPFGTITSALVAWAWYRWGSWRRQGLMLGGEDVPPDSAGHVGE
jgi:Na+-driven multidrug efflux pump